MTHEQTIWLPPRATAFTEVCEACEEEHAAAAGWGHPTVTGSLPLDEGRGWASCARGHTLRVLRMGTAMPAGALR
jgi:hypothetical protein